jgi:hypothetical protein
MATTGEHRLFLASLRCCHAIATVSLIGYTGFFVGPAILGFVAEHYGISLALGTVALILAAVCRCPSLPSERREASD